MLEPGEAAHGCREIDVTVLIPGSTTVSARDDVRTSVAIYVGHLESHQLIGPVRPDGMEFPRVVRIRRLLEPYQRVKRLRQDDVETTVSTQVHVIHVETVDRRARHLLPRPASILWHGRPGDLNRVLGEPAPAEVLEPHDSVFRGRSADHVDRELLRS